MEDILPPNQTLWKDRLHLSSILSWLPAALGVLGIIAGGLYLLLSPKFYNLLKKNIEEQIAPPENISEPYRPVPLPITHGKQTYTISGSLPDAPRISEVTFDPLDPAKGSTFTLSVKTLDGTGVTDVSATLSTDNKSSETKLNLSEGTNQDGVWKGTIKMDDSYDYKYNLTVKAVNTGGKIQGNTITVR